MASLIELVTRYGSLFVFAVTLGSRLGLPVPAAPLLVVAGGLLASGRLGWPAVLIASLAANLLGDAAWFYAGRWRGNRILRTLCRISLSPDTCVRQSEALVTRWGAGSLIAAKFLPGISVVAAPMAGALGMPLARFLLFDSFAALAWTGVFLYGGMVFAGEVQTALNLLAEAGGAAFGALLVAALAWLAWRYVRRAMAQRAAGMARIEPSELHRLISSATPPVVIDVRSGASRKLDGRRIPGALGLALGELRDRKSALPKGSEFVVYCDCPNDVSAVAAARILAGRGIARIRPLAGGLQAWADAGLPLEAYAA